MEPIHPEEGIDSVFSKLGSSKEGLSDAEAEKRLKEFGKNQLEETKPSLWQIFFRQFRSILIYILLAASLLSLATGKVPEFFTIIFLIIINGVLGFWQELKAQTSIEALQKLIEQQAHIIRSSQKKEIPSSEIAIGDIIEIHEGDQIPCDLRLIEQSSLMIDESSLTGESMPVYKDHQAQVAAGASIHDQAHTLFGGSHVLRGNGLAIAVATGVNTEFAKIAQTLAKPSVVSPLKKAMRFFARRYSILLCILFALVGVIGVMQGRPIIDMATIMIAELISAIPEGLPIVVTLVMVIGSVHLSRKQTYVRILDAVETLGCANVIASDKTGTITGGQLEVKRFFAKNETDLRQVASFCTDMQSGKPDPIDLAIANWSPAVLQEHKFWQFPFDTNLRLMAVGGLVNSDKWLFCKGSFEAISKRCENLDPVFQQEEENLLNEGLRTLAFARAHWSSENPDEWKLEMVGLIGFLDPPKPGVKEAMDQAKSAGIKVMMLTGDHVRTAMSVSNIIGIEHKEDEVLTGEQITQMQDEQLTTALDKTIILARILPEHKARVVELLQKAHKVVAVTGDGVNDVAALKAADLGIAMGSGSQAAQSVAKMIITNSDLGVIIDSIKNGRVIADNIRKVIYYLLSSSLMEIFLISVAIFTSLPLPLTPLQILWINLVTDGVQDKTFAFSKEQGDVMARQPRPPHLQFFDRHQIASILYFGFGVGALIFALFWYLLDMHDLTTVRSIVFTAVVVAQWFNGIQAQKEKEPFFKNIISSFTINPWIFPAIVGGVALQVGALYFVPEAFGAKSLSLQEWYWPAIFGGIAFVAVELRKWVVFLYEKVVAKTSHPE